LSGGDKPDKGIASNDVFILLTFVSLNKLSFFDDIRRRFLLGRHQTWLGSLKSTNLPFSRCHIFVSFSRH